MSEHFDGLPPSGGSVIMHTVVKGPSSQATRCWQNLFLSTKNHIKFCPCYISSVLHVSSPLGEPLHNRAGVRAGNFENDPSKIKMVPESLICGSGNNRCLPLKSTDSKPTKMKNPQIKNTLIDVL